MSEFVAAKAQRGAENLVAAFAQLLEKTMAENDAHTPISFPDTVYYLPVVLGMTGKAMEKISDLEFVLQYARELLHEDSNRRAGMAALLAGEALEALQLLSAGAKARVTPNITDAQVRAWGIELEDGRMPGLALLIGAAKNRALAVELVQELRRQNILCLLSGSIVDQLREAGLEIGEHTKIIPLGGDAVSAVRALGFAARSAMKLGGHKPGMWPEILQHSKRRTPGFVLGLGELGDEEWAVALGSKDFGFSVITDVAVSDAEQVTSVPFETIAGSNDAEKTAHLVEKCITARGLKLRTYNVNVPGGYGPAYEDEAISDDDLYMQFGGRGGCAFELLQVAPSDEVSDGVVNIIGPDLPVPATKPSADLGILVKVAGPKLQADYEPLLERQIHEFLSYASGVQHSGQADSIAIRISKSAAAQGFSLESIGKLLLARYHEEFATAVEKVEISLITEPGSRAKWEAKAREVHDRREKRLASLTDSQVDVFYVCRNCRSFAPNNVTIISPERISPCGKCNWLDAKAGFEMHLTSVRRPIRLGKPIDIKKGIWEGLNEYARVSSHGRVNEVALYSIMQSPACACADFEAIVMVIPEANGVMVLAHDDTSPTPAGVNVDIFASIAAGEQIPGVEGVGRSHLLSPKFISAEGGFKRVVWMSSVLKESMAAELQAVCEREGEPGLMDKIADERQVTSVDELVKWLKAHKHPAMAMEPMF